MNISSPSHFATQGIKQGFDRLAENTQKIIQPDSPKLEEALIDNKMAATQIQASAKALKTHDDMIGTLINIMA